MADEGRYVATAPSLADKEVAPLRLDSAGRLIVAPAQAGSAILGQVGIDQTTPGTTNGVQVNAGGAIGEVQASPTANTVLDRLKALLTGIVIATGSNVIGKVALAQGANWIDRSGTITTGGTAQNAAASNASRIGFAIQNNSSGDLWFNTLATAVQSQPSIKVAAGGYYETPPGVSPTGAISIIGATTAQAFSAREW